MSENIKHSSASSEWMTPVWLLEKVRVVLTRIDLDPASSPIANARVRAKKYLTNQDDGLARSWMTHWPSAVFVNPPGGKLGKASLPLLFWQKLHDEIRQGHVQEAIFLCFSIEMLQTSQNYPGTFPAVGEFPLCVPKKRIRFDRPDGTKATSPTHANAIVYVPETIHRRDVFTKVFRDVGTVL